MNHYLLVLNRRCEIDGTIFENVIADCWKPTLAGVSTDSAPLP